MNKIKLALFFLPFLIACQQDQNQSIDPSKIKAKSQTYLIKCDTEYRLKTEFDDVLVINKNTFDCGGLDDFEITLRSVVKKSEIILSGLQTVADDGTLLESAGMFKLDLPKEVSINKDSPIEYQKSSPYAIPDMELFQLDETANQWSAENQEVSNGGMEDILKGKELYNKECSMCHSKNLDRKGTGPALGRVGDFRDLDWLVRFTKNSQDLIRSGDSLALCIYIQWDRSIMTSYEYLSDDEIISIYKFIANESEIQKISIDSTEFNFNCDLSNIGKDISSESSYHTFSLDKNSDLYYVSKLYNSSWYNVDRFLNFEYKIQRPKLVISNANENVIAMLSFTNYKTVIKFNKHEDSYLLTNSAGKDIIGWPQGEKVSIVAYEMDEKGEIIAGKIENHIFKKDGNFINLTLEPTDTRKFNNALKKLDGE